jgi:2-amino-4-hydroxy-6-hydroxymethyldihydropteridine diphosphokinase
MIKQSFYVCYIGMGSNKNDRFDNLQKAVNIIEEDKNIRLLNVSSVYETKPFGNEDQELFLNAGIEILTLFSPQKLLKRIKEIELEVGRKKSDKWGPREIDLDIILYEGLLIDKSDLIIPHPGIYERDFVLVPLLELNDKLLDPKSGRRLSEFLAQLSSKNIIGKLEKTLIFKEKSFEEKS